ncbi:UTP--glucose-1-phosphate uridylyltransferase [Candidatus Photodesmus blepharus]|uniref:UTP--glucose-1-phosphate uridylyltransferase n=1 Tax=Candidatus Photodesmus blepharonis TaxID=1179155 RepID=A0A084CNJ3_9GAMM|nr:UTP--glucose-1-phosphate uridylyltransferase GalU [Candidatus Photodesmus blepharus]KEY91372.1 UTP--glucose-1-phosphate uridylyltransferase [Candidatus Photodesmus blepharus]
MIKKCLFPAAGYGTRFLPATKSMPKEMMPVVNKPLIEYGVEEAIKAGINNMCIVMGRGKHSIMDHFDKNYELEHQISGTNKEELLVDIREVIDIANFTYIRQHEIKGLGHAVLTGQELIGDEPFAVILSDDLCVNERESVLEQMVALYKQFRCSIIAVQEVPEDEICKYGIISGEMIRDDLYCVNEMIEKPERGSAPSNLAIVGRYILTPDIFGLIECTKLGTGGEIQLTDSLLKQARYGCVLAYKFKGKRFDCGGVEGYVQATNYFFEKLYLKGEKKLKLLRKPLLKAT